MYSINIYIETSNFKRNKQIMKDMEIMPLKKQFTAQAMISLKQRFREEKVIIITYLENYPMEEQLS